MIPPTLDSEQSQPTAFTFAFFYATSVITPSFASEGDSASQEDEVVTLESLTERIAGLENRIAELEMHQDEIAA